MFSAVNTLWPLTGDALDTFWARVSVTRVFSGVFVFSCMFVFSSFTGDAYFTFCVCALCVHPKCTCVSQVWSKSDHSRAPYSHFSNFRSEPTGRKLCAATLVRIDRFHWIWFQIEAKRPPQCKRLHFPTNNNSPWPKILLKFEFRISRQNGSRTEVSPWINPDSPRQQKYQVSSKSVNPSPS
jgi:hypothetical protein